MITVISKIMSAWGLLGRGRERGGGVRAPKGCGRGGLMKPSAWSHDFWLGWHLSFCFRNFNLGQKIFIGQRFFFIKRRFKAFFKALSLLFLHKSFQHAKPSFYYWHFASTVSRVFRLHSLSLSHTQTLSLTLSVSLTLTLSLLPSLAFNSALSSLLFTYLGRNIVFRTSSLRSISL